MVKGRKLFINLLILVAMMLVVSCAPARKNTYYQKRKKASHVNTEQLGRNRYFFSPQYQKKLSSNYKKKKVRY